MSISENRVYYRDEEDNLFECHTDKPKTAINSDEAWIVITANRARKVQATILDERQVNHLRRCIQQPNVSGLLDEKVMEFYHRYQLIDDQEYNLFLENMVNMRAED